MGQIFDHRFSIDAYRGENFSRQIATSNNLYVAFAAFDEACRHHQEAAEVLYLRQGTRVVRCSTDPGAPQSLYLSAREQPKKDPRA